MYILAIETTGPVGSVAVIDAEKQTYAPTGAAGQADKNDSDCQRVPMKVTTRAMSHLKNLIPMTDEMLYEEGIGKDEICAVAVSAGPGSFTGIRIGVSTARALAQAWNVPCISVPSLEVFRQKCEDGRAVCVIFNARRGQVYGACYGENGETLIEPGPYMLDEVLTKIEELRVKPVFYGDGVDAYFDSDDFRERVGDFDAAEPEERYQTADMVAEYALEVWTAGPDDSLAGAKMEYGELLPDYMRESEAEQRLKDGSLEKMRKEKMERFMKMAGKA